MEEVDAATEGAAVPEKSETKKRRRRRRNKGTGGTTDSSAVPEVPETESCGVDSSERVEADTVATSVATPELPPEQVDTDSAAICAATPELPAEQEDADAVAISAVTLELSTEQQSSTRKRRSRRRKKTRAADEVESTSPAGDSPAMDGCGDNGGSESPVVAGTGDGVFPTASVDSDGTVTFTVGPQDGEVAPEYRDLLQWLKEARAAANAPATSDDMYMTFTIRTAPLDAQSGSPTVTAGAEDAAAATKGAGDAVAGAGDAVASDAADGATAIAGAGDAVASAGDASANAGDAPATEVPCGTSSAKKRRNRRRKKQAAQNQDSATVE